MMHTSTNPVALNQPNFPRDSWWVAACAAEIGARPVQRWILEQPLVLYRGENGRIVALDDRCPHRWAPLSMGKVRGNDIACAYHGIRFGADGGCTLIPTQDTVPSVARVHSYPVIEAAPFVWVWTGDPALAADAAPPPALEWTADPARVTATGNMEVACNYLALKENVLDLSHFAFVHANTLAVTDWVSAPKVSKSAEAITYYQDFIATPLPAHYGVPTGIGCERAVNRQAWGSYVMPGLQTAGVDIEDTGAAPGQRRDFGLRILHATTPIDAGRCHYWWFFSQDYGHGPDAVETMHHRIETAFLEDKAILEATEQLVRQDRRGADYLEISVLCDRAGIETRRRVQQLVDREASR